MKLLGQLLAAVVIVACTGLAMRGIAERRNVEAAGGGAYELAPEREPAFGGYGRVVARIRALGENDVADRLEELRAARRLWVAPNLDRAERAIWVRTLRLVDRVYVAERELVQPPSALYPALQVPEAHLQAFSTISLAGTLLHELAHARGVTGEENAYALEIAWYHLLKDGPLRNASPAEAPALAWALDTAIGNAERARVLALGQ